MCDMCPDDMTDINIHRSIIKSYIEHMDSAIANVQRYKRAAERARQELQMLIRQGKIRNA